MPTRTTATATWDAPVVIVFRCPKCGKDVSLTRYMARYVASIEQVKRMSGTMSF